MTARVPYADLLRDPRWQKRRLERLSSEGWMCQQCGDNSKQLHVHHRVYLDGRSPWEYSDPDLLVLCSTDHDRIHKVFGLGPSSLRAAFVSYDDSYGKLVKSSPGGGCSWMESDNAKVEEAVSMIRLIKLQIGMRVTDRYADALRVLEERERLSVSEG